MFEQENMFPGFGFEPVVARVIMKVNVEGNDRKRGGSTPLKMIFEFLVCTSMLWERVLRFK